MGFYTASYIDVGITTDLGMKLDRVHFGREDYMFCGSFWGEGGGVVVGVFG